MMSSAKMLMASASGSEMMTMYSDSFSIMRPNRGFSPDS